MRTKPCRNCPIPMDPSPMSFTYYALATPTTFPFFKKECQISACLKASALAVPSAWKHSSPALQVALLFHPSGLSSNVNSSEEPSLTTSSKVDPYPHTTHHISVLLPFQYL